MFRTANDPTRVASRTARALLVLALLAWWSVCWLFTGTWFEQRAQESYRAERLRADDFVAQAAPSFDRIVRSGSGGPHLISRAADIQRVLTRFAALPVSPQASEVERRVRWSSDPELKRISGELKTAANDLGLDVLALLDVNGYCLAASNADSAQSIVGAYYGDRENFQSARLGHSGYLASAGKKVGNTGLTYYTPVTVQKRFVGVVSGGIAMAPYANVFDQADAFLSDRNGVVLLAQDPSLLLRTLPGAPAEQVDIATRQALYKRTDLQPLNLVPWGDPRFPELLRWPGHEAPVLLRSRSTADDGLNVSVLWPVPQLATLARQRWMVAGALGVPCTLLMLLAVVYLSQRREQRVIRLALAEREQRMTYARNFLEQIVNAVTEPLFVKDQEHRWIMVNQAFCKIHGLPRETFIGKRASDVFPEAIAQKIRDVDERVLTAGVDSIDEGKLVDSRGHTHIVVTKKAPYIDASGQRFIVGVISDISERKQVERLMRAREREFRSLAENLPDNVVRWDAQGRYIYINPIAERTIGAHTGTVFGKRPGEAFPDGRFSPLETAIDEAIATRREVVLVRQPVPMENGEVRLHEINLAPEFDDAGHVVSVLGIGRDMTDIYRLQDSLASREQEFRSLAEHLPVAVIRYDSDCRRRYLNQSAQRILQNHAAESDLFSGESSIPASPAMVTRYRDKMNEVLATNTAQEFDFVLDAFADHQQEFYEVQLVPEHGADGKTVGVLAIWYDITERKRMETELLAREQEFRTLVDKAPEAIFRYAPDGRRIYVNATVERLTGMSAALLLGGASSDGKIISTHEGAAMVALIRRICDTGEPGEIEVEHVGADGKLRYFHNRLAPELDAKGKVRSVFSICHDITERKHAERQLKEALEFSNGVINAIPDLLFELDREGRYLNVWTQNPDVQAVQKSELLGKSIYDVLTPDNAATTMQALMEADAKGSSFGKAICMTRPDGNTHWYEHSIARKSGHTPSDVTFLVLSRDVTRSIEAQQRLDETRKRLLSVLQTMPDMVWLKDEQGVYQLCNHAFSRLTGIAESSILGRTDYDLFDAELADFFRQQDQKAIEADTVRVNEEWVHYADDGHRALLETRKVPVYGVDGALTGVLGVARDITERREAELALRASEAHIQSHNALLQAIVESSPEIIIFALDTAYRYLAFNRKHRVTMQAMWGKDISIGMNMLDVIGDHPDRLLAQTGMDRALAGESFVLEETYGSELLSRQHWLNHWAPIRSESGNVVGLTCFVLNISQRRTAEERLRRSRDIVRALAAHQETEHENERKRLAYEIHEDLAQNFAALRLHLASLEMGGVDDQHVQAFETMRSIADHSIARIRAMVSTLRPAALDLGLVSALQWLADDFKGVGLDFVLALNDGIVLGDALTTFLYRAAREALLNIALHAAATQVHISLVADDGNCRLVVRDNGCGFDPAAPRSNGSFGLLGLSEGALHLGGELFVESAPGQGTTLEVCMPIPLFSST